MSIIFKRDIQQARAQPKLPRHRRNIDHALIRCVIWLLIGAGLSWLLAACAAIVLPIGSVPVDVEIPNSPTSVVYKPDMERVYSTWVWGMAKVLQMQPAQAPVAAHYGVPFAAWSTWYTWGSSSTPTVSIGIPLPFLQQTLPNTSIVFGRGLPLVPAPLPLLADSIILGSLAYVGFGLFKRWQARLAISRGRCPACGYPILPGTTCCSECGQTHERTI